MTDFAEAEALAPDEDPDALYLEARCSMIWWLSTIEPFLKVRFRYIERDMERIGRELTACGSEERLTRAANRAERRRALFEALGNQKAYWDAWHADRLDGAASGW